MTYSTHNTESARSRALAFRACFTRGQATEENWTPHSAPNRGSTATTCSPAASIPPRSSCRGLVPFGASRPATCHVPNGATSGCSGSWATGNTPTAWNASFSTPAPLPSPATSRRPVTTSLPTGSAPRCPATSRGSHRGRDPSAFTRLACPQVLCCVGNLNRIIPFYVTHMWMATQDKGLAATLYGPCTVTARVGERIPVRLTCTTSYPFEEEVRVRVEPERPAAFALAFRVPAWCASPSLSVGAEVIAAKLDGHGFVRVDRYWQHGETVTLRFPMQVRVDRGRETPYPRLDYFIKEGREAYKVTALDSPFASVSYGPLLFALADSRPGPRNTRGRRGVEVRTGCLGRGDPGQTHTGPEGTGRGKSTRR